MSDFSEIVAAHADAVWRTAYRVLNNHEDALDCYQETFLAALRLSPGEEVRHWRTMLLRIATRRAIDQLRQRYQGQSASGRLQQISTGRSPVEAPDARLQGEELREQVRKALAVLPVQQAEAFWLRHLEHLGPDEVARSMDIEPGHARVLVHRAAAGLRELLGAAYDPQRVSGEST